MENLNDAVSKYKERWISHEQRMTEDMILRQDGGLSTSGNDKKIWGKNVTNNNRPWS